MTREQATWLLAMVMTSICGLGQAAPFPSDCPPALARSSSRRRALQ